MIITEIKLVIVLEQWQAGDRFLRGYNDLEEKNHG